MPQLRPHLARSLLLASLVGLSASLTACSTLKELFTSETPYKPQREPGQDASETAGQGGYKTIIAGDDRFNVTYTVESKNDLRDAAIWGLYRCAEIARQEDAPYLVFIRGRLDGPGYSYELKGKTPYRPEAQPPTGIKGGSSDFLFRVFKEKAAADAFKSDPSVSHRLVYSRDELLQRLTPFVAAKPST